MAERMKRRLLPVWQRALGQDDGCRTALASYPALWEAVVSALLGATDRDGAFSDEARAFVARTARREGMRIGQYIRGLQLWRDVLCTGLMEEPELHENARSALVASCRRVADDLTLAAHEVYPEATDVAQQVCLDLAEHSNNMIFAVDLKGHFVFVNPYMRLCLGYRAEELLGQHFSKVIAAGSQAEAEENFRRAMAGERSVAAYELEYVARHGGLIPVELDIHTRRVGDRIVGRVGIARDVTLRRNIQAELEQRNRELTAMNSIIAKVGRSLHVGTILAEVLQSCMDTVGANGGAIYLADETTDELRCTAREGHLPLGPPEAEAPAAADACQRLCTEVMASGRFVAHSPELDWREPNGQALLAALGAGSCIAVPLRSEERTYGVMTVVTAADNPRWFAAESIPWLETVGRHIGVAVDNARLYAEARRMATTDSLTELPHHGEFYRLLKDELVRSRRYDRRFCVVMMDLDNLKATNDAYGHLTGDEALRQCARLLREHVREADTAARYGGDEFALILPETTADQAIHLARRVKQAVESFSDWSSERAASLRLGVSLGIAPFVGQSTDEDQLIDLADHACYEAKRGTEGIVITPPPEPFDPPSAP
jgi:diguanylate cyclase (GGDEF)-like protein/PAS domain S-box-containing protein